MKDPARESEAEVVSSPGLVSKHVQLFERLRLAGGWDHSQVHCQCSLFRELQPLCKGAEGRQLRAKASVNSCSKSADFSAQVAVSINKECGDRESRSKCQGPPSSRGQLKGMRCRSHSPTRTTDPDDLGELLSCSNLLVSAAEELAVAMLDDGSHGSSTHASTDTSYFLNCGANQFPEDCADLASPHGSFSPHQERSPSQDLLLTAVNDLLRAAHELNDIVDPVEMGEDSVKSEDHASMDMEAALRAACQELVNDTLTAARTPLPGLCSRRGTNNTSMRNGQAKVCPFASLRDDLLATVCTRCHPQHTVSSTVASGRDWPRVRQRMAAVVSSYCHSMPSRPCNLSAPPVTVGLGLVAQSEALVTQAGAALVQLEEACRLARSFSCPATV